MENNKVDISSEAMVILRTSASVLMKTKMFYYNLLTQFSVRAKPGAETLGVCWVDKQMYLIYDPEFVMRYTPLELCGVIEHECNHFLYDHVEEFRDVGTKQVFENKEKATEHIREQAMKQHDHHLRNIAMDRSINIYIDDLPNIRISRKSMLSGDKKKDEKAQGKILRTFKKAYTEDGKPDPVNDIVEVSGITEKSYKQLLIDSKYAGDINAVEKYEGWKYYYNLLRNCPKIEEEAQAIQTMDVHFVPGKSQGDSQGESLVVKGEGEPTEGEPKEGEGEGQGQPKQGDGNGDYKQDPTKGAGNLEREQKELSGDKDVTETPGQGPTQSDTGRMIFDAMRKSNASKLPGHLKGMLDRIANMYDSMPLPWYQILRRLVNTSVKTIVENNINVRNRRTTCDQILPGYTTRPLLDIAIVWDASGSCMDDATQGHFVNECNALIKSGANITVYYCDAQVEHVQKVGNKPLKPAQYQIKGGGGTDLDKGIVMAIKDKNHIIIQLTDGYMNYNLKTADLKGRKVITCTTGDKPPRHYGACIEINPHNKDK